MMGSQMSGQKRLFYSFNLDDHIPPTICYAASIDFSTSTNYANTSLRSIAIPVVPRSIPS